MNRYYFEDYKNYPLGPHSIETGVCGYLNKIYTQRILCLQKQTNKTVAENLSNFHLILRFGH